MINTGDEFNRIPGRPSQLPPPLPPRSTTGPPLSYGSYGNYGQQQMFPTSYGGWRSNMYGGGASYYPPPYGGQGMSQFYPAYGSSDPNQIPGSQFESASRPAFEMIESVVYTFGSVSQLLDSTYSAILASFRSVLAVFDQFSRMKNQFSTLFSAFALIKMLRWLRNKVSMIVALAKGDYGSLQVESAWSSSHSGPTPDSPPSKWPLIMYLALLIGAPYLTWKFLRSATLQIEEEKADEKKPDWLTGEGDHFVAHAEFSFEAQSGDEISFQAGDSLVIAPKEKQPRIRGWLLGSVDGVKFGLVPANRIKILERRSGTSNRQIDPKLRPDLIQTSSRNTFEDAFIK